MIHRFRIQRIHLTLMTAVLAFAAAAFADPAGETSMKSGESSPMQLETATFAGGCFWCMGPPFEKVKGVKTIVSGYTGGHQKNPTYDEVSSGTTGHTEAVQISFDPSQTSYQDLLEIFWRNIDPTTKDAQFVDRGTQYRTGIYYHSEEQKNLALKSRDELAKSGRYSKPIVTEILPAAEFYPAEDYHQDYHKKNPTRYKFYRFASGRDQYLEKMWGKERS